MKSFKTPVDRAEDDVKQTLRNKQIIASTVNRLRNQRHQKWSRDQLLCHPQQAMDLCAAVRKELPFTAGMDDFHILWAYLNASKRSKIAAGIPQRGRSRIK